LARFTSHGGRRWRANGGLASSSGKPITNLVTMHNQATDSVA
jgi:hypothetical protein